MKKLLIASVLALTSTLSQANTIPGLPDDICLTVNDISSAIMEARQLGIPAQKAVEVSGEDELILYFIQEAYEEPKWYSPELQQQAITEFSSRKYLECLRMTKS